MMRMVKVNQPDMMFHRHTMPGVHKTAVRFPHKADTLCLNAIGCRLKLLFVHKIKVYVTTFP